MARCRCEAGSCGCVLAAGSNIFLSGSGDASSPWVISAYSCVNCGATGNPGDVLTRQEDGSYIPLPPSDIESCVDCATPGNPGDVLTWQTSGKYAPSPGIPGPIGPTGPPGAAGIPGAPGQSVQIMGAVPSSASLPSIVSPDLGDGWLADDTGNLWVYTGPDPNDNLSKWTDIGDITGPAGPEGDRGSLWYSASGPPSGISGMQLQDHYLDLVTGDVYEWV